MSADPFRDLPKFGDGPGAARLAALLDALGIDRARLARRGVAICGSNGKGSTAALLSAIGTAAGLRTGRFTSPHLFAFTERFAIDGAPIADADLARLAARVVAAVATLPAQRFGAFEAQFALACLYFQARDCDLVVIEAGIGGRHDPVRLVGANYGCVASVDLEHTALLGDSRIAIACDKSDAVAQGGTVVYGENCRDLRADLAAHNGPRSVRALFVREDILLGNERASSEGQSFDLTFADIALRDLRIALGGAFQRNNAAIAATLFWLWARDNGLTSDAARAAIRDGLAATRWPGRLERIADDPPTVIDVGHTPDGIAQARDGLFATSGAAGWVLVLGVSADKDAAGIAAQLAPHFATIVCTAARHKGGDADALAARVRALNPSADVRVAPTVSGAVALSRALAAERSNGIYVAGGLFVAIEYAVVARGGAADDLHFF